MFGQETAVRGHQTDRPSVAPQDVDHGGNRVSYVIVQRTASKGKSTGLCELSFFAETQGLGADGPELGLCALRTAEGARTWGRVTDVAAATAMITEEAIGRSGNLDADGTITLG